MVCRAYCTMVDTMLKSRKVKSFPKALLLSLLCSVLLWLAVMPVRAAAPRAPMLQTPVSDNGGFTQPIDVVVLLDDSGSMATCWPWPKDGGQPFTPPCRGGSVNPPSDPNELRYSAARLLLQLAGDNDRVAVIRFDNAAEGVGNLGTLQPMGSADGRLPLTASLTPPTDYIRRGFTRIDLGLQAAAELLQSAREPGRNQYVILLTDGEPSGPEGFGNYRDEINAQITALQSAGVLLFPVILCNPTAGCAGKFLNEGFPGLGVRRAQTAPELLRIFSELFADIKPDLSVISSRGGGALQMTTRDAHGVRRVAFVTLRDGLTSVRRDDQPVLPQSSLNDPLVDVNIVTGDALAAGSWAVAMSDASGFAVVQTDSYPQLINPPPSLANSPAAVRYYPAGKPLLLLAQSGGPGADEPLFYDGKTPLQPFGQSELKSLLLNNPPAEVKLQLGDDKAPLQLVRAFRLEARTDLPKLEVFSPTSRAVGLDENGHAQLQVGFGGNLVVENLAATVYVVDESPAEQGGGQLVYVASMSCNERLCNDTNFVPADGRSYQITYVLQAQKDGRRFSDWGTADLSLKPAVQVRGLPETLDLAQMPAAGWPVELSAGATEPIGALRASLTLKRVDTGETVKGVQLNFSQDVPETGVVTGTLRVDGLETLRPGEYVGEIALRATRPGGQSMDVQIRPAPVLPVSLKVARPAAFIDQQLADFGDVLFDTSPNFHVDQELLIPVSFVGKRFKVTASLQENSCPDLTVVSGELQQSAEQTVLPLRVTSRGAVQPITCTGTLALAGPDSDFDLFPAQLDWQVRVNDVEWSIVSSALDLGNLQDAGARVTVPLLVRFTGKTPFILQMNDLNAVGSGPEGQITLNAADIEMSPVEVSGEPDASGVYNVPATLVARHALVRDPLRGVFFTGDMTLSIVGLEGKAQKLDLGLRSPSLLQRYVLPYVLPVYARLPWALCAWPLSLFLLLVMVARIRGRGIAEDAIDEAAVATAIQIPAVAAVDPTLQAESRAFANPASLDSVWGNAEWGGAWGGAEESQPAGTTTPANGAGGDPWRSSW